MKKYLCSVVRLTVPYSGARLNSQDTFDQSRIEKIMPPVNMVCNRVTFIVYTNNTGNAGAFLINTRPMATNWDGVILQTAADGNAVYIPARYTFETFNGEAIEQTFYLLNVNDNGDQAQINIVFEGFEK